MVPLALEYTVKQHVAISVIDHSMESTVGYEDHIPGSDIKRFICFLAYYHFASPCHEEIHFFLSGMPMPPCLLPSVKVCTAQHKII